MIVSFLLRRRAGDQYDLLPLLLGCKVVLGQISSKVIFRFSHFDTQASNRCKNEPYSLRRSISNQEFCCKEWQSAGALAGRNLSARLSSLAARIGALVSSHLTFFRRFNQTVDHTAGLSTTRGIGEESVFPVMCLRA